MVRPKGGGIAPWPPKCATGSVTVTLLLLLSEKFTEVLNKQREERAERDRERVRLLTADPFDPDAQRLIAEEIRQVEFSINYCLFICTVTAWFKV